MNNLQQYDFQCIPYNKNQNIDTNCIDMLFINNGTVTAYVDNIPLLPGQTIPINGNIGEICIKPRNLRFENTVGTPSILFVKRFYVTG